MFCAAEENLQEREAARGGNPKRLREEAQAAPQFFVRHFRFVLLGGHDRVEVLHEIDAALLAFSTLPLLVMARRTFKAQRHMAALAEAGVVLRRSAAFGALSDGLRGGG